MDEQQWRVSSTSYNGDTGIVTAAGLYVCTVPHEVAMQITADHNALLAAQAESEQLRAALEAINVLRDEIIRTQSIGWSRTVYPLVKILDDAGIASAVTDAELAHAPLGNRLDSALAGVQRATPTWPHACCRSWVYDPVTHGPSPVTPSGHHPACPEIPAK